MKPLCTIKIHKSKRERKNELELTREEMDLEIQSSMTKEQKTQDVLVDN
jgi:hypothetical protein